MQCQSNWYTKLSFVARYHEWLGFRPWSHVQQSQSHQISELACQQDAQGLVKSAPHNVAAAYNRRNLEAGAKSAITYSIDKLWSSATVQAIRPVLAQFVQLVDHVCTFVVGLWGTSNKCIDMYVH